MNYIKLNEANKVIYIALNKTTGLTDLKLQPYDEAGVAFGVPIVFSELANGAYEASFTPDAVGVWRVRVSSATNNDDAVKTFNVIASKLDDVKTVVDSVETKVDTIDTVVDATKVVADSVETKVDTIDTVVDAVKVETDKIQTVDDNVDSVISKVDVVDGVVDAVKLETDKIQTVDDNVDAVKTKTDNLPVNTAQELTDIDTALSTMQSDVTEIKGNVTVGGYFS